MPFDVRYNKIVAVVILALGLLVLGLNGFLFLLSGRVNPGIIAGIACTLMGFMYFVRPYFTVHDDKLVIHALIGPVKKTHPIQSPAAVQVDGTSVRINGKKIHGWLADGTDWQRFVAAFRK